MEELEEKGSTTGNQPVKTDESLQVRSQQLGQGSAKATLMKATEVAALAVDVIRKLKLYAEVKGKKYITYEGWTTLGAMFGVFPNTVETKEVEPGRFFARVELRTASGDVLGTSEAEASIKEAGKEGRPKWTDNYAVRSMAQTRAVSKAFRMSFSFVIKLHEYGKEFETTPAEEMKQEYVHETTGDVVDAEVVYEQHEAKTQPAPKTESDLAHIEDYQKAFVLVKQVEGAAKALTTHFKVKNFKGIPFETIKDINDIGVNATLAKLKLNVQKAEDTKSAANPDATFEIADGTAKYKLSWRKPGHEIQLVKSIEGQKTDIYVVQSDLSSCSCLGFHRARNGCKHIRMAKIFLAGKGVENG